MAESIGIRTVDALESISGNLAAGMGRMLTFDPSVDTVNTVAQDARFVVGRRYVYGNKSFIYTQFKDAVAYAVGQSCFYDAAADGTVTNDVSEAASATKPMVVGVCLAVQTENYYGFVQCSGPGTVLHNNDDDAAIGDEIFATVADGGVANVLNTFGVRALYLGVGRVAVVAATNLQSVILNIDSIG